MFSSRDNHKLLVFITFLWLHTCTILRPVFQFWPEDNNNMEKLQTNCNIDAGTRSIFFSPSECTSTEGNFEDLETS